MRRYAFTMRLLLVEDDPMIGEAVRDLLRAEGYAVDWANDGDMADAALATQAYDLVLLDLGLPRRDAAIVEPLVIEVGIAAQLFHLLRIIGQERFIPGAVVFAHMGVTRFILGCAGGTEVAQVLDARGAEAFDQ